MRQIRQAGGGKSGKTTFARRMVGWIAQPEAYALIGGLMFVSTINDPTLPFSNKWEVAVGLGAMLAAFLVVFLIQNDPVTTDAEVVR